MTNENANVLVTVHEITWKNEEKALCLLVERRKYGASEELPLRLMLALNVQDP